MSKYGKNKLTDEQRVEIRSLKGKRSAYKVADDFGVSHIMIYKLWEPKRNQKKLY